MLLALILAAFGQLAVAAGPSIDRAWIREAPPGAPAMAGFMSILGGSRDVEIRSASSADFGRIEIHEMSMEGDVMKMRPIETLEVPADSRITLVPGGEHLMLFDARRELKAGDTVKITFELSSGKPLDVDFEVRAASVAAPEAGAHQH
jgi:copper(I)-binding protein